MHPILARQLKNNQLAHSYLLVGKKSVSLEQIGELVMALKISKADIFDFSLKSEIKIEHVRQLLRSIKLVPHSSRYKTVILPVDLLNHQAAQALLKTLEEPPNHCLLLLYTPSERLVPATILSRCQRIYIGQYQNDVFIDKIEAPKIAEIQKMPLAERFFLAGQLADSNNLAVTLDHWIINVHNDIRVTENIKLLKNLLELKTRLSTNANTRLQLEAFFIQL